MFSGFESLYGSSMPQFVTANKRREVPVSPPLINLGYFGPVGGRIRTLEEQAAAAKLAHPNLRGGMLTMANKHQSDKEIAAAKNEAYWLNQAALQGPQFQPGQEHWTDPMGRFIFGSEEPGSGILAPMDYAGGAGSLLKWGAKAGAAALGGLMLRDFIKNPPEPGTLFSVFGHGTKASKLQGGKLNLRFVGDGTKGQGANSFGWGIYFAESKSTSATYAGNRKWNIDEFIDPLEKELEGLAAKSREFDKAWKELDARHRASINVGRADPNFAKEQKSINDGMRRAMALNRENNAKRLLIDEKIREVRSLNTFNIGPENYLKTVAKDKDFYDPEVVSWMKDNVLPNLKKTGGGSHLKVDIADEVIGERGGKLMDWYVPLNDHPAEVQQKIIKALRTSTVSKSGRHIPDSEILEIWGNKEGGEIYDALAQNFKRKPNFSPGEDFLNKIRDIYAHVDTDKMASEALQKAGILGTRFQSGTLTLNNADIVKTWAKPDNIDMNLVIWDQGVLDNMKYLGEF